MGRCNGCNLTPIKCDYDTNECDYETNECDYVTPECDLYTQSAIFTRRVSFQHAESNFHTQCDFDTHEYD
jgi:hypothetical protein